MRAPGGARLEWSQLPTGVQRSDDINADTAGLFRYAAALEILGHSQINLTQNTYQHGMPAVLADATARVADVLFPPTATTTAPRPENQEAS